MHKAWSELVRHCSQLFYTVAALSYKQLFIQYGILISTVVFLTTLLPISNVLWFSFQHQEAVPGCKRGGVGGEGEEDQRERRMATDEELPWEHTEERDSGWFQSPSNLSDRWSVKAIYNCET